MSTIAWDDAPSFPNRLDVPVHAVKENSSSFIRLLGPPQGVWVHTIQVGRQKRPKPHQVKDCPHCSPKNQAVWKPYAGSLLYLRHPKPDWKYVVLEMTAAAYEELLAVIELSKWRGQVVEFSRGKTNSRLRARWCQEWTRDLGVIPPPFDVRPVLQRLWGIDQVKPSTEPHPYEPPIVLPPIPPFEPAKPKEPEPGARETFSQVQARMQNGKGVHQ